MRPTPPEDLLPQDAEIDEGCRATGRTLVGAEQLNLQCWRPASHEGHHYDRVHHRSWLFRISPSVSGTHHPDCDYPRRHPHGYVCWLPTPVVVAEEEP